jgi:hypothetical protein
MGSSRKSQVRIYFKVRVYLHLNFYFSLSLLMRKREVKIVVAGWRANLESHATQYANESI